MCCLITKKSRISDEDSVMLLTVSCHQIKYRTSKRDILLERFIRNFLFVLIIIGKRQRERDRFQVFSIFFLSRTVDVGDEYCENFKRDEIVHLQLDAKSRVREREREVYSTLTSSVPVALIQRRRKKGRN